MSSVAGLFGVGDAGGEHWKRFVELEVLGLGVTSSWSLRLRTGIDESLERIECDLGLVSAFLKNFI